MTWIQLKNAKFSWKTRQLSLSHESSTNLWKWAINFAKFKNCCATESDLHVGVCIRPSQAECTLLTCWFFKKSRNVKSRFSLQWANLKGQQIKVAASKKQLIVTNVVKLPFLNLVSRRLVKWIWVLQDYFNLNSHWYDRMCLGLNWVGNTSTYTGVRYKDKLI